MSTPMTCPWIIDPSCNQAIWDAATPAMQDNAAAFATDILWAATGRQFSACTMTVRPCMQNGQWGWFRYNDGWNYGGVGGGGGGWVPFIWNGSWFNGCGMCGNNGPFCCEPRWLTQVILLGPVASVTSVIINGVPVTPSAYRIDDGQWLVRTDGSTWPIYQDLNLDDGATNTWSVTYLRGVAVPKPLLGAAGTLAIEYLKACSGSDCRLPGRVTSIIRTGVQITMVDPTVLLEKGLTGIEEVDLLIRSYNPRGLDHRLRLYSPDVEYNRVTTWQGA